MIEKRTVFVLGAGASCPYGFPTAKDLRKEILLDFQTQYALFLEAGRGERGREIRMNEGYPDMGIVVRFLDDFKQSSTESIDLFLSRNPRYQSIGKMAICLRILDEENKSRFREEVKNTEHDWYFYLYNHLTREFTGKDGYQEFGKIPIAFVTFNYDRSLEHFLFNSLLHSFEGADHQQKIKDQITQIPIIHVYGRIGDLERKLKSDPPLQYGNGNKDVALVNLIKIINNLYVVHEERTNPELQKAREEISKAERIFFLGFGFANENLETLEFTKTLRPMQDIYGTALKFTEREIRNVRTFFTLGLEHVETRPSNKSDQVKIVNCDCVALLREFL